MSPKPELPDDLARLGLYLDTFLPHRPAAISLAVQPPTNGFMVRHIPDEPLPPPSKERCLDAHDCRAPIAPSLQPAPAGKH